MRNFALGAVMLLGLCGGAFAELGAETGAQRYDLVVVGMGSGGFGAALAGARQGLSVLCLEISDRIGGNAVRGGVTMWEPGVGGTGIPFDIYKRLKKTSGAVAVYSFGRHISWSGWESFPGGEHVTDPARGYLDTLQRHPAPGKTADAAYRKEHWHGVVFEPDAYEAALCAMLEETGNAELRTETTFESVAVSDGRITGMRLTDGTRVTAGAYVDATGGGALCRACGCEMLLGQESRARFGEPSAPEQSNDRLNGVTLIFRVSRTDTPCVEPAPEGIPEECWWGRFPAMSAVRYPNGDYNCNMLPTMTGQEYLRLGAERAYAECERRVRAFWRHVQTRWPEFQGYRITWLAPALGVRETSRVLGEYMLREQDLRAGLAEQTHSDIITIADHSFDRHGAGGGGGEVKAPYGVPYRCLIPLGYRNLLIACRGAGFSSLAASSCRLSRTMMQLGQAAGTAAALAHRRGVSLPEVPPEALREALRAQHVSLDWPRPALLEAYLRAE